MTQKSLDDSPMEQHSLFDVPNGYRRADNRAPSPTELRAFSLWLRGMWQNKQQPEHPPLTNRKHPRAKELRILLLTVQLLILAFIFVSVIYFLLVRKDVGGHIQPISDIQNTSEIVTTTLSPATRYHRFPPGVTENKASSASSEDDTVYKALIYTDHPECTNVGRSFLLQGGNAQDAAVSALICLSAAHPHNTGLGGGFFAMIGITGKCVSIDARETASRTVTIDNYVNNTDEMGVGITSVATPGFLPGLHTLALTASGKFSLQELAQPTIDLCNSGILVDGSLATALAQHRDMILNDWIAKKLFVNTTTDDVLKKGERMYCSKYSQTLSEIVENLEISDEYMDQKPFAEQIVMEMEEAGGYVNRHDMEDFYVRKHIGESVKVGDFALCGPKAPSSFAVTALAVQADHSEAQNKRFRKLPTDSALFLDTIFPLAYRELKRIGDYEFDASNVTVPEMLQDTFVKRFVKQMEAGERTVLDSYEIPDHSTILVADEYGRAVSLSASLGDTFGSRFLSRLGFFYNNAMGSFNRPVQKNYTGTYDPELINVIQPGKAPRTYISPIIGYYNDEVAFMLSGADLERQAETVICLLEEEDCKADENMSPAIRQVDDGFQPLYPDTTKMAGY